MTTEAPPVFAFANNRDMDRLVDTHDWARTSLGPMEDWPQSLKTAVGIVLRTPVAAVLLWGPDGIMIYNESYSVFAANRHPAMLGMKVREAWPEAYDFNDNVMNVVLSGRALSYKDQELTIYRNGRAGQMWFNLDYCPVIGESGAPAGVLAICVDTSLRVLADRRLAAEHERLQHLFEQAPGFMAMLRGADHVFELVNPGYVRLVGARDILGKTLRAALPEVVEQGFPDALDLVFRTGQAAKGTGMKILLHRAKGAEAEERFVDFVYQPVMNEDGQVTHIFMQGSDVTERVLAERHLRLLMNELNHRVKNTMATVLAIVTRTLREAQDLPQASAKLRDRIIALSRAQDVLTRESWDGADMSAVVEAAIRAHAEDPDRRFNVSGPYLRLSPRAVLALSMAIHELSTNALKYGALSTDAGHVSIVWTIDRSAAEGGLDFVWTESGGPEVIAPERTGFGTTLIERGLAMELGGTAQLYYPATGVTFSMRASLDVMEENVDDV